MCKSPLIAYLGGEIILPQHAAITCTSGSGSLLDFAIASPDAREKVLSIKTVQVPFKPHLGLEVCLALSQADTVIRSQRLPWTTKLPVGRLEAKAWKEERNDDEDKEL